MNELARIYSLALEAFIRAGGCVKKVTVDVGNGQMVTFVRDRSNIGILG